MESGVRTQTESAWTILKEIEIDAPAERVWPFVATREGLEQWWRMTNVLALELRVGGRFGIRVQLDKTYHIVGQVVAYDPPRKFAVTWREQEGDFAPWPADTLVTFTLNEHDGRTRITVEHSGFEQLPEETRERLFQAYQRGWTDEEMVRLRDLVLQQVRR